MVKYLLKKSYRHKNLVEVSFRDLWNDKGIFTTMWIFGNPAKILFFKEHIKNLINSLKVYGIKDSLLKKKILKLLKLNIKKNKKYNHLLRVAVNKKIISISLRKKNKSKSRFNLKLVNLKRFQPTHKNLKYKKILNHFKKLNTTNTDIGLCVKKQILESGTSNILFYKNNTVYSPINNYYRGTTLKFFEKKLLKIKKKKIFVKSLHEYNEIILIGSGKGVTSVSTVSDISWKRKSLKFYKILSKIYNKEKENCLIYK